MKLLKVQEEMVYRLIYDDGTPVHPSMEQKANELSQLLIDSKIWQRDRMGAEEKIITMRIASVVLSNYELRIRKEKEVVISNDETPDFLSERTSYEPTI